jgi:hypothetical protein
MIKYSDTSIKIGMSSNIAKRIASYQGYQPNAEPPKVLLVIFTRAYEELETQSHIFAS